MKIKANFLLVSLFASLSSLAAETYQVSTSVYANGELVASPVIVVEADKMAANKLSDFFRPQTAWLPRDCLRCASLLAKCYKQQGKFI